jgi:hypothetical protein
MGSKGTSGKFCNAEIESDDESFIKRCLGIYKKKYAIRERMIIIHLGHVI